MKQTKVKIVHGRSWMGASSWRSRGLCAMETDRLMADTDQSSPHQELRHRENVPLGAMGHDRCRPRPVRSVRDTGNLAYSKFVTRAWGIARIAYRGTLVEKKEPRRKLKNDDKLREVSTLITGRLGALNRVELPMRIWWAVTGLSMHGQHGWSSWIAGMNWSEYCITMQGIARTNN